MRRCILLSNHSTSGLVSFTPDLDGCISQTRILSASAGFESGAGEAAIWACGRLKFTIFDCFPLRARTLTMVAARLPRSELALAGGREEALNGGLQLIPGYWAGFLGWGWAPLLSRVWRQGSGRIWGSLFLLGAHCEESFHSLGAHCLGISVHWSEPFFFLFKGGSGEGVNSPWGLGPLG